MSKFSNILLVSDFDRTLTDTKGGIPQANLEAIAWFMNQGGAFTIATGRSLPMSRFRFREIPMNAPLLVFNGAACFDMQTEQLLFCHPLPEDCVELMQYYERTYPHLHLEVHCLDKHYNFHISESRDAYLQRQQADYTYTTWDRIPDPKVKFSLYSMNESIFSISPESEEGQFFLYLEGEINRRGGGRYVATNSRHGMVEVQAAGSWPSEWVGKHWSVPEMPPTIFPCWRRRICPSWPPMATAGCLAGVFVLRPPVTRAPLPM